MRETHVPAVYLSERFWTDFGAATILAMGVCGFFGIPATAVLSVIVGAVSAGQAQRHRLGRKEAEPRPGSS